MGVPPQGGFTVFGGAKLELETKSEGCKRTLTW